jgi:hypothetical protein
MAIEVLEWEHARGHNGDMYSYGDQNSVASGAAVVHGFFTGPDETHLRFSFAAAQIATVSLYEGVTPTGGTPHNSNVFNRNRNCQNEAQAQIVDNFTHTGGTVIFIEQRGAPTAGNAVAPFVYDGLPRSATEWILAANTWYAFKVTNNDNTTSTISIQLNWYEYVD